MKKLLLLLGVGSVVLTGCVSPIGRDFNIACNDTFKPNVTTKEEAIACLGKPIHTTVYQDGRVLHQWQYTAAVGFGTVSKHLALVFDKNGKYTYTAVHSDNQ